MDLNIFEAASGTTTPVPVTPTDFKNLVFWMDASDSSTIYNSYDEITNLGDVAASLGDNAALIKDKAFPTHPSNEDWFSAVPAGSNVSYKKGPKWYTNTLYNKNVFLFDQQSIIGNKSFNNFRVKNKTFTFGFVISMPQLPVEVIDSGSTVHFLQLNGNYGNGYVKFDYVNSTTLNMSWGSDFFEGEANCDIPTPLDLSVILITFCSTPTATINGISATVNGTWKSQAIFFNESVKILGSKSLNFTNPNNTPEKNNGFIGELTELLGFSGVLSSIQLLAVYYYLANKWLTYKNTGYIGVGQIGMQGIATCSGPLYYSYTSYGVTNVQGVATTSSTNNTTSTTSTTTVAPSSISDLKLWFDAADTATLFQDAAGTIPATYNDPVGRWNDKSGNSINAVLNASGTRPTYLLDSTYSVPAINFDNAHVLKTSAFTLTDTRTVFVVTNTTGTNTNNILSSNDFNLRITSNAPSVNQDYIRYDSKDTNNNYAYRVSPITIPTNLRVLTVTYGKDQLYINRVQQNTYGDVSSGWQTHTSQLMSLGALFVSSSSFTPNFKGNINEILIYDRGLTDAEIVKVQNYLIGKWLTATTTTTPRPVDQIQDVRSFNYYDKVYFEPNATTVQYADFNVSGFRLGYYLGKQSVVKYGLSQSNETLFDLWQTRIKFNSCNISNFQNLKVILVSTSGRRFLLLNNNGSNSALTSSFFVVPSTVYSEASNFEKIYDIDSGIGLTHNNPSTTGSVFVHSSTSLSQPLPSPAPQASIGNPYEPIESLTASVSLGEVNGTWRMWFSYANSSSNLESIGNIELQLDAYRADAAIGTLDSGIINVNKYNGVGQSLLNGPYPYSIQANMPDDMNDWYITDIMIMLKNFDIKKSNSIRALLTSSDDRKSCLLFSKNGFSNLPSSPKDFNFYGWQSYPDASFLTNNSTVNNASYIVKLDNLLSNPGSHSLFVPGYGTQGVTGATPSDVFPLPIYGNFNPPTGFPPTFFYPTPYPLDLKQFVNSQLNQNFYLWVYDSDNVENGFFIDPLIVVTMSDVPFGQYKGKGVIGLQGTADATSVSNFHGFVSYSFNNNNFSVKYDEASQEFNISGPAFRVIEENDDQIIFEQLSVTDYNILSGASTGYAIGTNSDHLSSTTDGTNIAYTSYTLSLPIDAVIQSGTINATQSTISLNGENLALVSSNVGYSSFYDNAVVGKDLNGLLGEVILYDTYLPSREYNEVMGYLSTKWGIPVESYVGEGQLEISGSATYYVIINSIFISDGDKNNLSFGLNGTNLVASTDNTNFATSVDRFIAPTNFSIYCAIYNMSDSSLLENNNELDLSSSDVGSNSLESSLYLGSNPNFPDDVYSGKVGEVILYNRGLTQDETNRVFGYLSRKWGVGLFSYTGSGSLNILGDGVLGYVYTGTGSVVLLNTAIIPKIGRNYTGSGILETTSTSDYGLGSYEYTGSGILEDSGQSPANEMIIGGLVELSGTVGFVWYYGGVVDEDTETGFLTFTGSATYTQSSTYPNSIAIVGVSGEASCTQQYSYVGQVNNRRLIISGIANARVIIFYPYAGSGSVQVSGNAIAQRLLMYIGGARGRRFTTSGRAKSAKGRLKTSYSEIYFELQGEAAVTANYSYDSSGEFELSPSDLFMYDSVGEFNLSGTITLFPYAGSGIIGISGTNSYVSAGEIDISGEATYGLYCLGNGTLNIQGEATYTNDYNYTTDGVLEISGAASVVQGPMYYNGSGELGLQGEVTAYVTYIYDLPVNFAIESVYVYALSLRYGVGNLPYYTYRFSGSCISNDCMTCNEFSDQTTSGACNLEIVRYSYGQNLEQACQNLMLQPFGGKITSVEVYTIPMSGADAAKLVSEGKLTVNQYGALNPGKFVPIDLNSAPSGRALNLTANVLVSGKVKFAGYNMPPYQGGGNLGISGTVVTQVVKDSYEMTGSGSLSILGSATVSSTGAYPNSFYTGSGEISIEGTATVDGSYKGIKTVTAYGNISIGTVTPILHSIPAPTAPADTVNFISDLCGCSNVPNLLYLTHNLVKTNSDLYYFLLRNKLTMGQTLSIYSNRSINGYQGQQSFTGIGKVSGVTESWLFVHRLTCSGKYDLSGNLLMKYEIVITNTIGGRVSVSKLTSDIPSLQVCQPTNNKQVKFIASFDSSDLTSYVNGSVPITSISLNDSIGFFDSSVWLVDPVILISCGIKSPAPPLKTQDLSSLIE